MRALQLSLCENGDNRVLFLGRAEDRIELLLRRAAKFALIALARMEDVERCAMASVGVVFSQLRTYNRRQARVRRIWKDSTSDENVTRPAS